MIEFRTKYSEDTGKYLSPTGDGYMDVYAYKYSKDGTKELVKDSKTNVYEAIQADFESCDINSLMKRFTAGETDIFNRVQGIYADLTDMPKTWAELYQMQQEGENQFLTLPVELREMFNNSAAEFFAEAGTKGWTDKVKAYADQFIDHRYDDPSIHDDPEVKK